MEKEQAKKILEDYLIYLSAKYNRIDLPITDVTILKRDYINADGVMCIEQYSFIGLLKIIYDLK